MKFDRTDREIIHNALLRELIISKKRARKKEYKEEMETQIIYIKRIMNGLAREEQNDFNNPF